MLKQITISGTKIFALTKHTRKRLLLTLLPVLVLAGLQTSCTNLDTIEARLTKLEETNSSMESTVESLKTENITLQQNFADIRLAETQVKTAETELLDKLIKLVEKGEIELVRVRDHSYPYRQLVRSCSDGDECAKAYSDLISELADVNWDLANNPLLQIELELYAMSPVPSNPAISRARSAYLSHISAWQAYYRGPIDQLPYRWSTAYSDLDEDIWLSLNRALNEYNEIYETFDLLCVELGNAQTPGEDKFKARIMKICEG